MQNQSFGICHSVTAHWNTWIITVGISITSKWCTYRILQVTYLCPYLCPLSRGLRIEVPNKEHVGSDMCIILMGPHTNVLLPILELSSVYICPPSICLPFHIAYNNVRDGAFRRNGQKYGESLSVFSSLHFYLHLLNAISLTPWIQG